MYDADRDYWELISRELQHEIPDLKYLKDLERKRNEKIIGEKLWYPTTHYFQGNKMFECLFGKGY